MADLTRGALNLLITFKLNVVPLSETNERFLKLQRLLFIVKYEYKNVQVIKKSLFSFNS